MSNALPGLFIVSTGWRMLRRVLSMGLLATWSALAQTQPDAPLPEALQGIKPAAGRCLRDGQASPKVRSRTRTDTARPDLSCTVAPEDLSRLLKRPDTVLVDVRTPADYAAFHIDGALNTTASELRTKRFLRGKTVVLIGNGKAERELYAACSNLKTHGFKEARVLRGGTPAWLSSGQAVLGKAPPVAQLATLTPLELWIESRFDANMILVTRSQEALQRQVFGALPIPDESPGAVRQAVERYREKFKQAPLASVVLVTNSFPDDDAMRRLRQAVQSIPLLIYTDTAETYARQLAQQGEIWTTQARGPRQPGCGR